MNEGLTPFHVPMLGCIMGTWIGVVSVQNN